MDLRIGATEKALGFHLGVGDGLAIIDTVFQQVVTDKLAYYLRSVQVLGGTQRLKCLFFVRVNQDGEAGGFGFHKGLLLSFYVN